MKECEKRKLGEGSRGTGRWADRKDESKAVKRGFSRNNPKSKEITLQKTNQNSHHEPLNQYQQTNLPSGTRKYLLQ